MRRIKNEKEEFEKVLRLQFFSIGTATGQRTGSQPGVWEIPMNERDHRH